MLTNLSLAKRLLLWVIPVSLMGIYILGTTAYLISRRHILQNVEKEIETLAREAGLSLSGFFRQRLNDLETVAETPLLTDYYNNRDFGLLQEAETYRQEIETYLVKFSERVGVYNRLIYINDSGGEICKIESSRPVRRGVFKDPALLKKLSEMSRVGHHESSLKFDSEFGPVVLYAKPLFSPARQFKGAIVIECSLKPVQDILNRLNIGSSGWAHITDNQGNLILGSSPRESVEILELLTSEAQISGTAWTVSIGAEMGDFLEPLEQIKYITTLLGVLCGLLVVLFIYFRVRALIQPIQKLVETTRRLEGGDLSGRVAVTGPDEIGTLSKAFNTMAESLEDRTRDLEARIRQLTALREMENAVLKRLDEETILKNCLKAVAKGFSFDRTALYWVDPQKQEIVGRHLYGARTADFSEDTFRMRRVPLDGKDILSEVIRTRNAVLVRDLKHDERLDPSYIRESKTREFVLAPICGQNRVFGVLAVDNYYSGRALKESDKDGLTLFANSVGLALENLMLLQHLTESEIRYRTVLESSPVAVLGLSREHWITTWNRGAEHIFGYGSGEIIGKPLTALVAQELGNDFNRLLAEMMDKGSVRDYSISGLTKDGRRLDLSLSWGGAYQDFWMNKEWAVVIRDVTEAKKLQHQIIRSEKLSAVGQLISSIAHELNNPLQAVIGYAQLLSEEDGAFAETLAEKKPERRRSQRRAKEQEMHNDLRMILENAMRCRKIINNLLLFVRHEEVEKRPVHLEEAINASLELLEYKIRKSANIRVEFQLTEPLPAVKADFQQIQQVFVNFINNACDSMSGWNGPKKLLIRSICADSILRVEVTDSGPGIPLEVQERLFEPFFTTKPEGRGTGLGLIVCRQIIEDHGGKIGFISEVGQGATFWIELPVAATGIVPIEPLPPLISKVPNKKILVVDDEPDVLSFLEKVITSEGDLVETAYTLEAAAAKIAQKPFDLIVTDIRLGEGTGTDLYERWSGWSSHPKPKFIFLTGDVLNPTLEQSLEKQNLILLKKPVDLESSQLAVRTVLTEKGSIPRG